MVIHELYRQKRWMYKKAEHSIADRIVNLYQPHVRPMPGGKDRVSTEFGSRENRRLMKEKGIRFVGRSLGRPDAGQKEKERALSKEMTERNGIEGKFGQGKNGYGLAKIRAKL